MTERLFSFEYSAPKTDEALDKLKAVHARLQRLQPHFCSVTYGAGGSTKEGTRQTVLDLAAGVQRLITLRGDRPSPPVLQPGLSVSGEE